MSDCDVFYTGVGHLFLLTRVVITQILCAQLIHVLQSLSTKMFIELTPYLIGTNQINLNCIRHEWNFDNWNAHFFLSIFVRKSWLPFCNMRRAVKLLREYCWSWMRHCWVIWRNSEWWRGDHRRKKEERGGGLVEKRILIRDVLTRGGGGSFRRRRWVFAQFKGIKTSTKTFPVTLLALPYFRT